MALAINNNLMANNVTRNLNTHYGELGKSTQRLSSGLRVSSASDDAAGLAIRELMRGDIAALGQGVRNANDAISMIQTADGALGVIDSKLIRMKELAEQSASGTYKDSERKIINLEYQKMADEITRIAEDTDFNGKKLLNGSGLGVEVEKSDAVDNAKNAAAISDTEGSEQTWQAVGAKQTANVTTQLKNLGAAPVGDSVTYTNATGGDLTGDVITFNSATGLEVSTNVDVADGDAVTFNHSTGEITGSGTIPAAGSNVSTFTHALDADASTQFKVETKTGAGDWVEQTVVDGTAFASTAGDSVRITANLADGRVVQDTIENNTDGVFTLTLDDTAHTLEVEQTTASTTALRTTSDLAVSKDFEFTSKTGAKVTTVAQSEFDVTSSAKTNESDFTHNTKTGVIEDAEKIESTLAASYGKPKEEATGVKVEVFDKESNTWQERALSGAEGSKSLDIDPNVETFRVTVEYGDGDKKVRDTISNNTDGAFTIQQSANGFEVKMTDTDHVTTGDQIKSSSTQLKVVSEDLVDINVHFGSSSAKTDSYNISMDNATAKSLGVGADAKDDVLTAKSAKKALDNIDRAIAQKDLIRAEIGSTQNRLDATISNISVQKENLQAAESRISDVDVATEMTEFNKQQILANAAVSMLSQANNLPKMAQKLLG